jgi:hypothetical protein
MQKSDLDIDRNTEDVLINALDNIRQNPFLQGTQITTYTHDPLVGVTTITLHPGSEGIFMMPPTDWRK